MSATTIACGARRCGALLTISKAAAPTMAQVVEVARAEGWRYTPGYHGSAPRALCPAHARAPR